MRAINHAEITWKGDSKIFACNYAINGGFKCLTRDTDMNIIKGPARADKDNVAEKNVFSVSEKPVIDMYLPVSMMPSGSLIAGYQVIREEGKNDLNKIIFWEKNGLRHGQINLPDLGGSPVIRKLKFNSDSTFLAALVDFKGDKNTDSTIPESQIFIFHRSNYHWFIKRSLSVQSGSEIFDFHWLSSKKNQIMILSKNSDFAFYDFHFTYQTSSDLSSKPFEHLSYTVNIDYRKAILTPFKKVVIPPPMGEKEISLIDIPSTLCFYRNMLFLVFKNKIGCLD